MLFFGGLCVLSLSFFCLAVKMSFTSSSFFPLVPFLFLLRWMLCMFILRVDCCRCCYACGSVRLCMVVLVLIVLVGLYCDIMLSSVALVCGMCGCCVVCLFLYLCLIWLLTCSVLLCYHPRFRCIV